jgi:hypothetical protein
MPTNSGAIGGGAGFGRGGSGVSNAGKVARLTNTGTISGGEGISSRPGGMGVGGAGVSNETGATIGALVNQAGGLISGGNIGSGGSGPGGAGVFNAGTITRLANSGTINGGNGGNGIFGGGAPGAGVSNSGAIATLTNSGAIGGGNVGAGSGDVGGAGVSNAGTITKLTNQGTIRGGAGKFSFSGGAGVSNAGTIRTLSNSGAISGGNGGAALFTSAAGGAGGAGVSNSGTITTLTNKGKISGGNGGSGGRTGGAGGAGIANSSTIGTLTNSGTIHGGRGGGGPSSGAPGDAILSAGAGASIGHITNSGKIIGFVEIDNQASVTVTGGSGTTFGSWTGGAVTGGAITIGNGNLTFAGGNTALGVDVSVNGGNGTVTNRGALRLAAPETIAGNFTQTAVGVLGLDFAGDLSGEYGALTVSKLTTLNGGLAIDLTGGFTLATGDQFDILGFGGLTGNFTGLSLDGAVCSSPSADRWTCGGGVRLNEVIHAASLDLVVAHALSVSGPASSPIPEPSTWAMLGLGFVGLGGLRLMGRGDLRRVSRADSDQDRTTERP